MSPPVSEGTEEGGGSLSSLSLTVSYVNQRKPRSEIGEIKKNYHRPCRASLVTREVMHVNPFLTRLIYKCAGYSKRRQQGSFSDLMASGTAETCSVSHPTVEHITVFAALVGMCKYY